MEILHYIREQTNGAMVYWTVENNAIGEAALVVIRDTGEENFPGEMLHEPKKIQGKKGRRGYHTTHKSKIESCLTLKRLVEQDKIFLKSKPIVSELKKQKLDNYEIIDAINGHEFDKKEISIRQNKDVKECFKALWKRNILNDPRR